MIIPDPVIPTSGVGIDLEKYVDELPRPPRLAPVAPGRYRVRMRSASVQLHRDLPPTRVWTYEGQLPGPTIEVRRGEGVEVEWVNELDGPFPVTEVRGPALSENHPGRGQADPDPAVEALTPWNVVHVHGAKVPGHSDGWTENALVPHQSTVGRYPNEQRAMHLWYHDHAMGITRLTVFAGLAGTWLVRDDVEDSLQLPSGDQEVVLLLQDRNLDTADGGLTGQLLHKTEDGTAEFFGPYTMVNGKIWPYLDVEARSYRLRVLNGSNARTYRLRLLDEQDQPVDAAIHQIGTDGGLLGAPVALPADGLVLAPAERADLVVDFAALRGRRVRWVNTAPAPFHGPEGQHSPAEDPPVPGVAQRGEARLPEPDVMQFRVGGTQVADPFSLPDVLDATFVRRTHDSLPADHTHRLVALVERGGVLQLCELQELPCAPVARMGSLLPGGNELLGTVLPVEKDGATTYYAVVATRFDETTNWHVALGSTEVWKVLNLTEDTHPFHVHLVQFQALRRDAYDVSAWDPDAGTATAPLTWAGPRPLDDNERGDKDTIRVDPGDMITIAATFEGGTGRYMYHCHILEHEDDDMMRSFVVAPAPVLELMGRGMPGTGMPGMPGTGMPGMPGMPSATPVPDAGSCC